MTAKQTFAVFKIKKKVSVTAFANRLGCARIGQGRLGWARAGLN